MKVAVVGVTGMVGQVMCRVLEEERFPVSEFIPVASERSVGKSVTFKGREVCVIGMQDAVNKSPDIALFSAGGGTSKSWAPAFADKGTIVIDNSSAWRMDPGVPLVVPEINAHAIESDHRIIANPNCSTIQMVMALAPLHKAYGIKRLVVSTYQSITGTGVKAVQQYRQEMHGEPTDKPAYPHPIFENCLPHCDVFLENGYTKEEMKLVHETRKILDDQSLAISATAVRVPVVGGHSESVNVEFARTYDLNDVIQLLRKTKGVTVLDDVNSDVYPMPLNAKDKNDVFVGRIRPDISNDQCLNLWIVADNLRKGAATNAVQIAQYLVAHKLVEQEAV